MVGLKLNLTSEPTLITLRQRPLRLTAMGTVLGDPVRPEVRPVLVWGRSLFNDYIVFQAAHSLGLLPLIPFTGTPSNLHFFAYTPLTSTLSFSLFWQIVMMSRSPSVEAVS